MTIPLIDYAGLAPEAHSRLAAAHAGMTTLAAVLDWGRGQAPPLTVEEIVTQDEYTHDVLIPDRLGNYLVYDTT